MLDDGNWFLTACFVVHSEKSRKILLTTLIIAHYISHNDQCFISARVPTPPSLVSDRGHTGSYGQYLYCYYCCFNCQKLIPGNCTQPFQPRAQSLRVLLLKNEFVETNDKYPATHTHPGTQKQLTVKSKRSGFRNKWHISIKKSYKNGF